MKQIILALGIAFGSGLAEARDWGFSKDTVYAWVNGTATSFETRNGVQWPRFDSVYLENHGTTALKFDSAILQIVRPNIGIVPKGCIVRSAMALNLRAGPNGPSWPIGEFDFRIPSIKYLPTGFETFSLLPGEKIIVGPSQLYADGDCYQPIESFIDSVTVRIIFAFGPNRDSLYIKAGKLWTSTSLLRKSEFKSPQFHMGEIRNWIKSFLNRDLKGRNSGP